MGKIKDPPNRDSVIRYQQTLYRWKGLAKCCLDILSCLVLTSNWQTSSWSITPMAGGQWRNYGRQWRQPPPGASPEGAPRDQCQKKILTPHRLTIQSRRHDQ